MSKKAAQKKRATNKKKSNKKKLSVEFVSLLIILICMVGLFSLGIIGIWLNLIVASLVGTLYWLSLLLIAIYAFFRMFKGRQYKPDKKRIVGSSLLIIGTILMVHIQMFDSLSADGTIFQSTLEQIKLMLRTRMITNQIGTGIIGGALYHFTHVLIGKWGSFVLSILFILFGSLITVGATWADVMAQSRLLLEKITIGIKNMQQINRPNDIDEKRDGAGERHLSLNQNKNFMSRLKEQASQLIVSESDNNTMELPLSKGHSQSDRENKQTAQLNDNQITSTKELSHSEEALTVLEKIKREREAYEIQLKNKKAYPNLKNETDSSTSQDVLTDQLNYSETSDTSNKVFVSMQEANQLKNKNYKLPPLSLLNQVKTIDQSSEYDVIEKNIIKLESTFKSFGVDATVVNAHLGPAVTKFEVKPALGVKVNKIVQLTDDLALALAAKDIRIEAPIPGKPYVGIEVPNQTVNTVSFREVVEPAIESKNILDVALGRGMSGATVLGNLAKMPHLLVAGATGSGKSVAINGMITSLLLKAKPNEVKMLMIDPKKVELSVYNDIPHLLTPVVTNPKKAAQALQKVVEEMERRYELFAASGTRNMTSYNEEALKYAEETGNIPEVLPYIVVIVDELADLMMVASNEVESAIIRLAQMARAAGIHMVLATQRPSVDVITGIIKANVPSRIAFSVSSGTDSRTIIDSNGAEKLLGRGDMLFLPMGASKPDRVQGAFISDEEVERIVRFVKEQEEVDYVAEMSPSQTNNDVLEQPEDELFYDVIDLIRGQETISISMLQRKFRIGYNRAARLIDELEERQMVSPPEGSKPRQVLLTDTEESNEQTN